MENNKLVFEEYLKLTKKIRATSSFIHMQEELEAFEGLAAKIEAIEKDDPGIEEELRNYLINEEG